MAPRKKVNLSANEWQIMSVLWQHEGSMVVSEIMEALAHQVNWSYSTYQTQLGRLVDSGYIAYEKRGRTRFFYPVVALDQCVAEESETIRSRMPEVASNQLLLCLMRDAHGVTAEEAEELSRLVEKLRSQDGTAKTD